jgi:hypothetical protein
VVVVGHGLSLPQRRMAAGWRNEAGEQTPFPFNFMMSYTHSSQALPRRHHLFRAASCFSKRKPGSGADSRTHGMGPGLRALLPAPPAEKISNACVACVRRSLRVAACCLLRRRVKVAFIGRGRRTCSFSSPVACVVVPDSSEFMRGVRSG